uniref:Dickkopf N-terminal cysteine-rich domain-containing protein n=1 Tax=Cyprinodon variegatus TaxID=28743 RepID=A0A3Q2DJW6_CYPVA
MSGTMLLSALWALCLLWRAGAMERGPLSLNEMFREVEELMEDTQHMLDEAVHQVCVTFYPFTSKHSSGETIGILLQINLHDYDRKMSVKECMVDEDCGDLKYCLYEIENSKCLPCIPTDMPCTKDEECCSDQMCVWGQCTANAIQGTAGTICQGQSDCSTDLCCAFQREFLFPVCSPKPAKGESCLNHPNLLMDMLEWDQEGPRDYCPCVGNLQCQPHSVCSADNASVEEEMCCLPVQRKKQRKKNV